jgi:NAD(P)-dependent dehydrogenase (short-subunit alcohol dehydrogenase family)
MTTVLITGANRGIGLALTKHYAGEGADVIACCRTPDKAGALNDFAATSGGRVRVLPLEVADDASIAALKRAVGDQPIDILINNAGILGSETQSCDEIDVEGWMKSLRVNALGPVLIAQALRDNVRKSAQKKIVAISSDAGSNAFDCYQGGAAGRNRYAYRASKAALNSGMIGLARDWKADGVLVLMLNPGFVQTDMPGPRALASPLSITAETSARGISTRIAELTPITSGSFRDYGGQFIPW